ncbi:mutT family protein [Salmonella sp. NCTC 11881]|nr:mutT family protein [Salmonella sp. NCTC 11881]
MFKPHVTVACIVHAEDKFLVVEETINGKSLWNQPAGHLEADETLAQAAARETVGRDWHHGATTVFYPYASVDCAG